MIWSNRRSAIDPLGAAIETASLIDLKHRFHAYRLEGVIDDSLLHRPVFPAQSLEGRPALSVLLRGRLLVRRGDERRWLEPGEGYVMAPHSNFGWRILAGCHGLTVSWTGEHAASELFFRVSDARLDALLAASARLHAAPSVKKARAVHTSAIEALLATGLVPAQAFETTPCEPSRQALAMAVDARLSDLAGEPMQVELQDELGISERQLRRITGEMFKLYGFVDANWGEARVRRRLSAAVAFMSNPAATVSLVAKEVGYHSTQAMARAFGRAGFPAPGQIRARLAELAER